MRPLGDAPSNRLPPSRAAGGGQTLILTGNEVSDISPLLSLARLAYLELLDNPVEASLQQHLETL